MQIFQEILETQATNFRCGSELPLDCDTQGSMLVSSLKVFISQQYLALLFFYETEKHHMAYKMMKTECKLIRTVLVSHGFHEVSTMLLYISHSLIIIMTSAHII